MKIPISIANQSGTLATIKTSSSGIGGRGDDTSEVLISGSQLTDTDATVTTVFVSSLDSKLPNTKLEDVLIQSGADVDTEVELTFSDRAESLILNSVGDDFIAIDTQIGGSDEQAEAAISAIEYADVIVVQVESSNDIETVTVSAADIESVYTHASTNPPGVASPNMVNILLLKNGWAYTNLQSSPLDLPVLPAEPIAGNGWAMWRADEDGAHEIKDIDTGVWSRLVGQVVDISPKEPSDVAGVFRSHSTDMQIIYSSSSTTTLQMSPDGVFTSTRTTFTSSNSLLADVVPYTVHAIGAVNGGENLSSEASTFDDIRELSNVPDSLSEIAGDMFGVFRILEDGITLELQFADGSVQRKLYLKTEKGNLSVGSQYFAKDGDVSGNTLDELLRRLRQSNSGDQRGRWLKVLADSLQSKSETARKYDVVSDEHASDESTLHGDLIKYEQKTLIHSNQ